MTEKAKLWVLLLPVIGLALSVGGCGKKGGLDAPPGASLNAPDIDKPGRIDDVFQQAQDPQTNSKPK